jgi:hypothetical protein
MKTFIRLLLVGLAGSLATTSAAAQNITFNMVRSAGAVAADCIPNAKGRVTINSIGIAEVMHVEASGLPDNTDFDVFVIQLPNAPFGLSWYQGDLKTDSTGKGVADFIGRFSVETFIVAPGSGPAPVVFNKPPFPDASSNPTTGPIHTYHVGLWFNSPAAAANAGCPNTVTPLNSEHNAGIQAISTRNFGNLNGPLRRLQ